MTALKLTRTVNLDNFYLEFHLHLPTPNIPEGYLVTHVFNRAFDGTLQEPPTEFHETNTTFRLCPSPLSPPKVSDLSYQNKSALINSKINSIIIETHRLTVNYLRR